MKCPMKNYSDYDMEAHKDLIDSLYSHANQELGFKKPPMLIFQSDPRNYGALSKTAQYDPSSQEITIYVDGRHIKDILRSFAHELVHHYQNEQGRLSGANVTQGEQDFDDIEGEAYHTGNLKLFRKWEDGIKQNSPTIYNERRIYKMSTKKWKNKELSNLMTEKYGFKMDLRKLNESVLEEEMSVEKGVEKVKAGEAHPFMYASKMAKTQGGDGKEIQDAILKALKDQGVDWKAGLKKKNEELDEGSCSEGEMGEAHCMEEELDEGKDKDCPECKKAKSDCECPDKKEAMDEEKEEGGKKEHPLDVAPPHTGKPDAKDFAKLRKDKKLKEHKIWNDKGFKMDLNKLLK